jgi:RecB family exonuclease
VTTAVAIAPTYMGARCAPGHLSHSQVQTFTACPRRWTYEKVEQAPRERVSAALVFGCAVHDALAAVNEAALHGEGVDAPARFVAAWKEAIAREPPVHYGKDDADDLLAKGRALVATYTPPSGIIGVEQPFSVSLDPDLPPVEGRIDLIRRDDHGDLVVADLKTAGTRVLTDTHAVEAQLALYDCAYPAARHEAIVLAKLKTPVVTVQPITIWPHHRLVTTYRQVFAAMAAGVRYAVRGWHCEGCPFASRCAKEG